MAGRRYRLAVVWTVALLLVLGTTSPGESQFFDDEIPVDPVPVDPLLVDPFLVDPFLLDSLFPCRGEVAIFSSLKHGSFDYCRQHLRYVSGSFDCLRIIVPTCNVFPSGQAGLVIRSEEDRIRAGHAERIVCPDGPPPPTCPGTFPAGPIPRP